MLLGIVLIANFKFVNSIDVDSELDFDADDALGWDGEDEFIEELLKNPELYFDAFENNECDVACASLGYYDESQSCIETCQLFKAQLYQEYLDPDEYDLDEYNSGDNDEFEFDQDEYNLDDDDSDEYYFEDDIGDL